MRTALMCIVLGVSIVTGFAQPIVSRKSLEIAKRPVKPTTRAGDLTTASTVTMHFRDASVREVLIGFASQIDAGVTIEATDDGLVSAKTPALDWVDTAHISVDLERASYWDAITALVKAMPVTLDPQGREGVLTLVEHGGWRDGSWVSGGRGDLLAMIRAPSARRAGALLFAARVLSRNFAGTNETRLVVSVAAEPRVNGVSGLAVLRLSSLTGADGTSFIANQHEFVTNENHSWSSEYARWGFDLGDPPSGNIEVNLLRGELWVATGKFEKGTFDLAGMFSPLPSVPGEVQVDEECQIFRAPNFADARDTSASRERHHPDECRVVNERHHNTEWDGESKRTNVDYTEEFTLVMHNVTHEPETFVIWTKYPPDAVRYTSTHKPALVQGHGEYRVKVAPGETERLRIAYEADDNQQTPQPQIADVPFAPKKLWQQVTVGETRITVQAVVPRAGEYVLRGEFSSPLDGPVKYACPYRCQMLAISDAQGRWMLRQAAFGPVNRVGGREVMEWSLFTAGRGLVPSKLEWGMEDVTSLVKIGVK